MSLKLQLQSLDGLDPAIAGLYRMQAMVAGRAHHDRRHGSSRRDASKAFGQSVAVFAWATQKEGSSRGRGATEITEMTDMRRGAVTARFMLYLSSLTVGVTYLAIVGQRCCTSGATATR